jgi:hypothetical protein
LNKKYLERCIIPKYAKIWMKLYNIATQYTVQKAETIRIKQGIKLPYNKKLKLNKELYHIHIEAANLWNTAWPNIEHIINHK